MTRLTRELGGSVAKLKVAAANDRQYLTWVGGAIVTSINTFQSVWITQSDYQECGPSIIYRKCI